MAKSVRRQPIQKKAQSRDYVLIYINGIRHEVRGDRAGLMLSDYLREVCHLTGTKVVCAEGDCGACSVIKMHPYVLKGQDVSVLAINSCIVQVAKLDGSSLVTIEGISPDFKAGALSHVQQCLLDCHGTQCGFCTPGFVVSMQGLAERCRDENVKLTPNLINAGLSGNLCRCTGYVPIRHATAEMDLAQIESVKKRYFTPRISADLKKQIRHSVHIEAAGFVFDAPIRVEAIQAKDRTLIGAGTDLGVLMNKGKSPGRQKFLSLHLIPALYRIQVKGTRVTLGARVTVSDLEDFAKEKMPFLVEYLERFASPQIRHQATVVGNLANASPIGDLAPFFLSCDAILHIRSVRKLVRKVPMTAFYRGYKEIDLKEGECILAVEFVLPGADEKIWMLKESQRRDLDISTVNGAFRLKMGSGACVEQARLSMGGVGPTSLRLFQSEKRLEGKVLDVGLIEEVICQMQEEISPIGDLRGSATFRRVLAARNLRSFLQKQL